MSVDTKVRISCLGQQVIFEATMPVAENRSASYDPYNIIHLPTSMWAYKNTSARKFQLTGKLVSRNQGEAETNAHYLNLIRRWILPDFGRSGATPPIVKLYAYGNTNISGLDCILTSYSWQFPEEVDYIFTSTEPMPVIGQISVELDEVYSARDITAGRWWIKVAGETTGNGILMDTTPSLPNTDVSFQGLAQMGLLNNSEINSIITASSDLASIAQNPTLAKLEGLANSPMISESTAAIPVINNNRNITGILPGETSGVPQDLGVSTRSTSPSSDPFGRVTRALTFPLLG